MIIRPIIYDILKMIGNICLRNFFSNKFNKFKFFKYGRYAHY